jgi:hypothetical protein
MWAAFGQAIRRALRHEIANVPVSAIDSHRTSSAVSWGPAAEPSINLTETSSATATDATETMGQALRPSQPELPPASARA